MWKPIESCPINSRTMFVAIAFGAEIGTTPYNSDPYCVWRDDGKFVRWPHKFPPTHWMELPKCSSPA